MPRIITLLIFPVLFSMLHTNAQNSLVGDGFGGRGWYVPHNYSVGSYNAFTVCGDNNQLYGWGCNFYGELGNDPSVYSDIPVPANGMSKVKFYSAGYFLTVIKSDNTGWVWAGGNIPGFSRTPEYKIDNVKFAHAGMNHVVFVKNDGTVWGVGTNNYGELGNGMSGVYSETLPVQMIGMNNAVRAIAVGRYHPATVILNSAGSIYVTGSGKFQNSGSTTPLLILGLNNIVDIKGNGYAAYALDSAGNVFSFGIRCAALGTGVTGDPGFGGIYTPPNRIIFPSGASPIIAISSTNDGYAALALDSKGKVYAWGYNGGNLGDGTIIDKTRPVWVADSVIDIYCAENYSYILKLDNSLWATGISNPYNSGSIWMNLPNIQRNIFTRIEPTISPMNLCSPKVFGIIPTNVSNFNCALNDKTVTLSWFTAKEFITDNYEIEYSSDSVNYQLIATIPPRGHNSQYSFTHTPASRKAFYRLKTTDRGGVAQFSETCALKINISNSLTVAPNPTRDIISVFGRAGASIRLVQILGINGQLLRSIENYTEGNPIDISRFPNAVYILKVIYQNNEIEYARVVKW